MPHTANINPNEDTIIGSGWAAVGGPGGVNGALADASDATYAVDGTTFAGCLLNVTDVGATIYNTNRVQITGVQIVVRGYRGASFNSVRVTTQVGVIRDDAHQDDHQMAQGSGAVAQYNGRVRNRAPDGSLWNKAKITALGVTFWPNYQLDITLTRLFVVVTYYLPPVTVVSGPTGTVPTATPLITWLFDHEDGLRQTDWQVRVFRKDVAIRGGFDPDTSGPISAYSSQQSGTDSQWRVDKPLVNGVDYVACVRTAVTLQGETFWSEWSSSGYWTVSYEGPAVPTLTVEAQPDAGRSLIRVQGTDNLLTANEADLERVTTEVDTWAQFAGTVALANSATVAAHGTRSLRLTAGAAATMTASAPLGGAYVRGGEVISARAKFRAGSTGRSVRVSIVSWDASTFTGAQDGTSVSDSSGAWVDAVCNGFVVPAGSLYVTISVTVLSPANGEIHYVDQAMICRGDTAPTFTRGGAWIRNLLTADDSDFETSTGLWAALTNTTIARSTTVGGRHGSAALRLTAGATLIGIGAQSWFVPVLPGFDYTALASFRPASGTRDCAVGIVWLASDFSQIDDVVASADTPAATGGWTDVVLQAGAPENAAYASLVVLVNGLIPNADVTYVDAISIARGTATIWSRGQDVQVTSWLTVEASDDDGATWIPVRGGEVITPDLYQAGLVYDVEAPPGQARRYRARTTIIDPAVLPAPNTISSANSDTVAAVVPTRRWWIKSLTTPGDSLGFGYDAIVRQGGVSRKIERRQARFDGIGASLPTFVVDSVGGEDGSLKITIYGNAAWAQLKRLLTEPGPLLLIDPIAQESFYMQVDGTAGIDVGVVASGPKREVSVDYVQVPRP